MNPSFQVQLQQWCRKNKVSPPKKPNQKPKKRKSEHLSKSEWKDIMGMNRTTYHRHRGALKQN